MNRLKFTWNYEYIIQHRLDESVIENAGIELRPSEIFVEHPEHEGYYISQFGRCISLKRKKVVLLGAFIGGQPDRQYLYYGFSSGAETKTIGVHRAVADVFTPNFWKKAERLEAHHIDGNKMNNNFWNLILLTPALHGAIHKIKKIVLLDNGKITEYQNPLDLVHDTGLKLEDILLANKGKKKPIKSDSKYTVFNVKGHLIGFQYYPAKSKSEKAKKK